MIRSPFGARSTALEVVEGHDLHGRDAIVTGHLRSGMHFEDPHYRVRPCDPWEAYLQSKTANVLFAVGLTAGADRLWELSEAAVA